MKIHRHDSNGFGLVLLLLSLSITLVVGSAGWYVWRFAQSKNKPAVTTSTDTNQSKEAILTGILSTGPTEPVCRDGQTCGGAVASNHIVIVLDNNGKTVASTKTNDMGVYTFNLQAGQYVLKLEPKIGMSDASYRVTVAPGTNNYDIEADSGIR